MSQEHICPSRAADRGPARLEQSRVVSAELASPESTSRKPLVRAQEDASASTGGSTAQVSLQTGDRREVACQTDAISDFALFGSLSTSAGRLENRSTQTEPATRSVFTRSSRFLPEPNEHQSDRPFSAGSASPSHRGDSTAVLSRYNNGTFSKRNNNFTIKQLVLCF